MSILYAYLDQRTHTFINVKENIILYSTCKPNHKKIDHLKKNAHKFANTNPLKHRNKCIEQAVFYGLLFKKKRN